MPKRIAKPASAKSALTRAVNKVEALRKELRRDVRKEVRGGTRKEKAEAEAVIARTERKLDKIVAQLQRDREALDAPRVREKPKRKRSGKEREPQLIGEAEYIIRGYWDRYPATKQKEFPHKFAHVPKSHRRGPTVFDQLKQFYDTLSLSERRRIQVRVAYGINKETGKILTEKDIGKMLLSLNLSTNRDLAYDGLSRLLVRAGVVDTPSKWKVNRKKPKAAETFEDTSVPLGVQWWLV